MTAKIATIMEAAEHLAELCGMDVKEFYLPILNRHDGSPLALAIEEEVQLTAIRRNDGWLNTTGHE